jgi:hypothetical protein
MIRQAMCCLPLLIVDIMRLCGRNMADEQDG